MNDDPLSEFPQAIFQKPILSLGDTGAGNSSPFVFAMGSHNVFVYDVEKRREYPQFSTLYSITNRFALNVVINSQYTFLSSCGTGTVL